VQLAGRIKNLNTHIRIQRPPLSTSGSELYLGGVDDALFMGDFNLGLLTEVCRAANTSPTGRFLVTKLTAQNSSPRLEVQSRHQNMALASTPVRYPTQPVSRRID
jgi:hypothetical protein